MKITDVLDKSAVFPQLESKNKPDLLRELSDRVAGVYQNINPERLNELIFEREKLCSTAIYSGVAIPHAVFNGIPDIVGAFAKISDGIEFGSLDSKPTSMFFLILSPENSISEHIDILARAARIFRNPDLRSRLMKTQSADEIYDAIVSEDEKYS